MYKYKEGKMVDIVIKGEAGNLHAVYHKDEGLTSCYG